MRNLAGIVFVITHLWAVALCVQVNGLASVYGWVSAIGTLALPFLAEVLWGVYAYVHGHPFLWAVALSAILLGVVAVQKRRKA